jgi:hypothetical protein
MLWRTKKKQMSKFIRRDENSIDRLFRQKLHDAEEPTPLYLWEGVRQRSAPKRRFLWWWFAGAIVALGLVTWAVSGQFENNNTVAATANEVISPIVPEKKATEPIESTQTNSADANASGESNLTISTSDNKAIASTSNSAGIKSSQIKKQSVSVPKKEAQKLPDTSLFSKYKKETKTEPLAESIQLDNTSNQSEILTENPGETSNTNTNTGTNGESPDLVPDVAEAFQPNPTVEDEQNIKAQEPSEESDSMPNDNASPFAFSIGVYGLAGKPQGVKDNDPNYNVVTTYESSYNNDPKNYSLGFGLFGKGETKKHFTLQLGFDAQKVTSKVELTKVEVGEVIITSITPDSSIVEDLVPTYTFRTTVFPSNYILYNTYLLVGKDFHWRKIYFGIQTGPVLRFNTVSKALPETYNDSTYVIYPPGRRLDLQASAQFGVLLNDHLNLFVHFQERWMLPAWKTTDARMVHPAVGLGVTYKFH